MADDEQAARPRVLVLGGGFAGVGAARALKKADVDVVIVDKHDYHTFQPLLYQVATALLEPAEVGHPLRDLFDDQKNARVHVDSVTGIDLAGREVQFAEMKPLSYDYLVLGLGAEVNFFGASGAPEHAFPMYTLADAIRLRKARAGEVGGRGQGRLTRRGRRTAHRRRRRRPHRGRERRRAGGAVQQHLRRGLPGCLEGARQDHARGGLAAALRDVQGEAPRVHQEDARGVRRRGPPRRDRRVRRADAGQAQVREGAGVAHARLGRRSDGEPDRARPRGRARSGATV